MEPVLAHHWPDFNRHCHCNDEDRPVQRRGRFFHDPAFRALCDTLVIPGVRRIFNPGAVSRVVEPLAVTQPQDHWAVFCGCDGLAVAVYRVVDNRAQ